MTKLKLHIGAIIALAIFAQPFYAQVASAASEFDNALNKTEKLEIVRASQNKRIDLSTKYVSYLQACDAGLSSDGISNPGTLSSYRKALQTGSWSVFMEGAGYGDYNVVVMWSIEKANANFYHKGDNDVLSVDRSAGYVKLSYSSNGDAYWDTPYTVKDDNVRCQPYLNYSVTEPRDDVYSNPQDSFYLISSQPRNTPNYGYDRKLFLSTAVVNYPAGYSGSTVPQNYKIPYDYYVHFKVENQYNVNFSAKYTKVKTEPAQDNPPKPQKVFWLIQDPDKISSNTGFPTTICSDYIDADKPFTERNCPNVQFEKKKYLFKSEATHVFDDEENASAELTFKTTTQKVDFNTMMKYDTEKCEPGALDVGEAVNCAAPSEYEDCDIEDLACHLRNFGVRLKHIFYDLFVPDFAVLEERFATLNANLRDRLGFVWYPFDWLGLTFNSLTQSTASCHRGTIPSIPYSSNLGNGKLFGSNVNLNPCSLQNQLPIMYDVVVFIFRALTVFAIIIALNHKYRTFLGRGY